MSIYAAIDQLILEDAGKRGIITATRKNPLREATEELRKAQRILLTTGFYILEAENIETDGPPGILILANTLGAMGKDVSVIIESYTKSAMLSAAALLEFPPKFIFMNLDDIPPLSLIDNIDIFLALERPGAATDGNYYNFKGKSITNYHVQLDRLFLEAKARGAVTIGIGDGGNEMGMGSEYEKFSTLLPAGKDYFSITVADYAIVAGVSNWAGYALAALLCRNKKSLQTLLRDDLLNEILLTLVSYGVVDGITRKAKSTVDGLAEGKEVSLLGALRSLIMAELRHNCR